MRSSSRSARRLICRSFPVRGKPALVLRTDVANVYGTQLPRSLFSRLIEEPVLQAVQLDAACVVVNLFRIPDQPEVSDQCIQNILHLRPLCTRYGMPLMIEPLVFRPNAAAGGYMVDGDPQKIIPLVRQAVELGADIIKADPTDDVSVYHRVVEIAGGIPVLVRGGGKAEARPKSWPAPPLCSNRARLGSSTAGTSSSTPSRRQ